MEESASIDWARVMRGINSTANAVSCCATTGSKAAGSSRGLRKPTITAPAFSLLKSSGSGRFTQARTSAPASSDRRSVTLAPAALYSSSRKPAFLPAPASTATSTPLAASFLTDSGTNATRASPGCCSTGTAIRIGQLSSPGQKNRYRTRNSLAPSLLNKSKSLRKYVVYSKERHSSCDDHHAPKNPPCTLGTWPRHFSHVLFLRAARRSTAASLPRL